MKKISAVFTLIIIVMMIITGCMNDNVNTPDVSEYRIVKGVLITSEMSDENKKNSSSFMIPVQSAEVSVPSDPEIIAVSNSDGCFTLGIDLNRFRSWQQTNNVSCTSEVIPISAQKEVDGVPYVTTIKVDFAGSYIRDLILEDFSFDSSELMLKKAGFIQVNTIKPAAETCMMIFSNGMLLNVIKSETSFKVAVAPGTYQLIFSQIGSMPQKMEVSVSENQAVELGTITLSGLEVEGSSVTALRWFGNEEQICKLDLSSGKYNLTGVAGDLQSWTGQSVIHNESLYVFGESKSQLWKIYKVNISSGLLESTADINRVYTISGHDHLNRLVCLYWNKDFGEVYGTLDPETGCFKDRGIVVDMKMWRKETVIVGDHLYVLGNNREMVQQLYTIDLITDRIVCTREVESESLHFAGISETKNIICLRWNKDAEEFGIFNPLSGDFSLIGVVGDMKSWTKQSVIIGRNLYVLGNNSDMENRIYCLDVSNGELLSSIPIEEGWHIARVSD